MWHRNPILPDLVCRLLLEKKKTICVRANIAAAAGREHRSIKATPAPLKEKTVEIALIIMIVLTAALILCGASWHAKSLQRLLSILIAILANACVDELKFTCKHQRVTNTKILP